MAKHRISLPPAEWPVEIRDRFEAHADRLGVHQHRRLSLCLGRWLKAARDEGVPPNHVTANLWHARTSSFRKDARNALRQAVVLVYPEARAILFAREAPKLRSKRAKLAALIERNLARWPEDWRTTAAPMLHIDPDELSDGILIQAWSPQTVKGRVQYLSTHFAFCRKNGLSPDVTRQSVRANLRDRQTRCTAGDLRIGGALVYLDQLCGIASAIRPDRDWKWLRKTRDRMKKIARHHPSRNDSRIVEIPELRDAALKELAAADKRQTQAMNHRQRVAAHTRARTALAMLLLSEAPVRIESAANIATDRHLSEDGRTVTLQAHETKERAMDTRQLSDEAVAAIRHFVSHHRAVVAPLGETRLFLADDGAPLSAAHLSRTIGDHCKEVFDKRTTAHPIRNSVASYILSEAPEEAGLASLILHHSDPETTNAYTATAHQVIAGNRLRESRADAATSVGALARPRRMQSSKKKPRSLRAELARRRKPGRPSQQR
ncbi:tyrosine-type recombinase/integrase [Amaricoccus macauensis]|uniref:tyrosine-type recombinase/integrase n=1 Tax=Amaricoccus macauensis TaxID=57001 RepID=UPI003C7CBC73